MHFTTVRLKSQRNDNFHLNFPLHVFLFFFLAIIVFDNINGFVDKDEVLGDVPQMVIDEMEDLLRLWHADHIDLVRT